MQKFFFVVSHSCDPCNGWFSSIAFFAQSFVGFIIIFGRLAMLVGWLVDAYILVLCSAVFQFSAFSIYIKKKRIFFSLFYPLPVTVHPQSSVLNTYTTFTKGFYAIYSILFSFA